MRAGPSGTLGVIRQRRKLNGIDSIIDGEIRFFTYDRCRLDDRIRHFSAPEGAPGSLYGCLSIANKDHVPDTAGKIRYSRVPGQELLLSAGEDLRLFISKCPNRGDVDRKKEDQVATRD